MMTGNGLRVEVVDGIGTITLDRPATQNALTAAMLHDWAVAVRDLQRDPAVRVLVARGAGTAFSAGVDLTLLGDADLDPWQGHELMTRTVHEVVWAVEALTKPYVAVVSGPAIGAGMDMALMADYRIADATALFSEAYIRVGLVPGDGGAWYLPRLIGRSRALRLLWTGESVDADRALEWGIVDEVVPASELDERAGAFARRLAASPPAAVELIKRAVRQTDHGDLRGALDLIAAQQGVIMSTASSRSALRAASARHHGKENPDDHR